MPKKNDRKYSQNNILKNVSLIVFCLSMDSLGC